MRAEIIETESLLQHRRQGPSPRHQEGRHYSHTKLSNIAATLALTRSETVSAQLLGNNNYKSDVERWHGGVKGYQGLEGEKKSPRLSSLLYTRQRQQPADKGAFRDMSRSQTQQLFI